MTMKRTTFPLMIAMLTACFGVAKCTQTALAKQARIDFERDTRIAEKLHQPKPNPADYGITLENTK